MSMKKEPLDPKKYMLFVILYRKGLLSIISRRIPST